MEHYLKHHSTGLMGDDPSYIHTSIEERNRPFMTDHLIHSPGRRVSFIQKSLMPLMLILIFFLLNGTASTEEHLESESVLKVLQNDQIKSLLVNREKIASADETGVKQFRKNAGSLLVLLETWYMFYPKEGCAFHIERLIEVLDACGDYRDYEELACAASDSPGVSLEDRKEISCLKAKAFADLCHYLTLLDNEKYWDTLSSFLMNPHFDSESQEWSGQAYFWDFARMGLGRRDNFRDNLRIVLNHQMAFSGALMKKEFNVLSPEEFHAIRISLRNFRNLLTIHSAYVKPDKGFSDALGETIDQLGKLNDRTTFLKLLEKMPGERREFKHRLTVERESLRLTCIKLLHTLRKKMKSYYMSLNEDYFIIFADKMMEQPEALCIHGNELFVVDARARLIYLFSAETLALKNRITLLKSGESELQGIAADRRGHLFVLDEKTSKVHVLAPVNGEYKHSSSFPNEDILEKPRGIAVTDDTIYVTDSKVKKVYLFGLDHTLKRCFSICENEVTQIESIIVDSERNMYLSSEYRHYVGKYDRDGRLIYKAGEWIFPGQPEQITFCPGDLCGAGAHFMVLNEISGSIALFSCNDGAFAGELSMGSGSGFGKLLSPDGMTLYRHRGRWKLFICDQLNRRMVQVDLLKLMELQEMEPPLDLSLRKHLVRFCEWVTGVYFNLPDFRREDRTVMNALARYVREKNACPGFALYWKDVRSEYCSSLGVDIVNNEFVERYFSELDVLIGERGNGIKEW